MKIGEIWNSKNNESATQFMSKILGIIDIKNDNLDIKAEIKYITDEKIYIKVFKKESILERNLKVDREILIQYFERNG